MHEIDFTNKIVIDFGTGTAILSILAEKLGAEKVIASDKDEWSINANENLLSNNSLKTELRKTDTIIDGDTFDIILTNINKNVILDNFLKLVNQLKSKGIYCLAGY